MANYDLTYEGSRVQGILDTGNSLKDAGYIFRGEATPSTVPGTPTERVAYIGGPGTYTNFGGSITVGAGCICVFKYTGSAWSNQVINTGLDSAVNTLQSAITAINNNIGNGYVYAGVATPSTSPVTGKVFYLAVQAGTYTNFGNAVVTAGLNVIKYNGSAWSVDQVIAIDAEPTQGSDHLVKSGGVLNSIIQNGSAFDLSAYNAQGGVLATYADLSAALTALNALPADFKKGGMSFKFVLSSDNKYVQYRLMSNTWSTTVSDWYKEYSEASQNAQTGQVDIFAGNTTTSVKSAKPILGFRPTYEDGYSDISAILALVKGIYFDYITLEPRYYSSAVATLYPIPIQGGVSVKYSGYLIYQAAILEYDEDFNVTAEHHASQATTNIEFTTNTNTKYIDFCAIDVDSFTIKVGYDYSSTYCESGELIGVSLLKKLYNRLPAIADSIKDINNTFFGISRPSYENGYTDLTDLVLKAEGIYYDGNTKGIGYFGSAIATAFPIPIPGSTVVNFTGSLHSAARLLEYDEDLNVINQIASSGEFTTNAKTKYVDFCSLNKNSFNIKVALDYSSSYFEKGMTELFTLIKSVSNRKNFACKHESMIGAIPFEGFNTSGYSHIILYGQSLSTGDNSYVPVTGVLTPTVPDVLMVGEDVTDTVGAFAQLKAKTPNNSSYVHSNGGESPICNATYAIKTFLNHTPYRNVKIIGSACGYGGTTIEQLGNVDGTYYNRFKTVVNTAKTNAGAESINCPAIVWMQGEYNQMTSDTTTVADYKEKLVALKNNMQQYVMAVYGQTQRPLFFVYQPSVLFTPKFPIVAQALFECAQENEDIILMNPHYFCPTSDGGHLTSNGYRWYGEYIAKAIIKTILLNKRATAIIPAEISWNENKTSLFIRLQTPNKPNIINNWNVGGVTNLGFALYKNNSAFSISSVKVNDEFIEIKLGRAIGSYTRLELEYAGQATNGVGNIADSDDYVSFGEFVNPSTIYVEGASTDSSYTESKRVMLINSDLSHLNKNGDSLVGEKYPNSNWMNTFRIDITNI